MRFTFDPKKDKVNQEKHGLSLSVANEFDWDDALTWVDVRKNYGELRCISLVPINQRLYCVVYVDIKLSRRIISLRKANLREIDKYEEEID
jgi:uncharacterized DUF497 family protein